MRILIAALLLLLAVPTRAEPIRVVASFSVLADIARNAGGENVVVTSLIGPDIDPHGYESKPSDARKLAGASVLLVNGLGFDSWADRLATASGFHGRRVVATASIMPILHDGLPDPHAWQSAANVLLYVDAITDALVAARPDEADALRNSASSYKASLSALDQEIRATLAPIPPERRRLIVPHRAFDYFGRDYGLAFLAPLGTDADAEATASGMAGLVEKLRRGEVRAIFAEHLEDRRIVERIAAETGQPIAGELYSDALSPAGGPAATYIDLMRRNARIIGAALAPP